MAVIVRSFINLSHYIWFWFHAKTLHGATKFCFTTTTTTDKGCFWPCTNHHSPELWNVAKRNSDWWILRCIGLKQLFSWCSQIRGHKCAGNDLKHNPNSATNLLLHPFMEHCIFSFYFLQETIWRPMCPSEIKVCSFVLKLKKYIIESYMLM